MKNAYMFFNCDINKNWTSMNPEYNKAVYKDTREGRRALWRYVKKCLFKDLTISVYEIDIPFIRKCILEGRPTEANAYITYGHIVQMNLF